MWLIIKSKAYSSVAIHEYMVGAISTNPTPWTYVLQFRHGHLSGTHFLINLVNFERENFFISAGIIDHILGARKANVSVPHETVLTFLLENLLSMGFIVSSTRGKTSFIISGDNPYATLYSSIPRVWMVLWWIVYESSLASNSSNVEFVFWWINRRVISWILLIQLFIFRLWNIQTSGQYPNWDIMKQFMTIFLCLKVIRWLTLERACSFCEALVQSLDTCLSNVILLSISMPKSFWLLEFFIIEQSILIANSIFLSLSNKWNLSGSMQTLNELIWIIKWKNTQNEWVVISA